MKKSNFEKLSNESLLKKKSNSLIISIIFIIIAAIMFYLALQAVRRPNPLGENSPSSTFFRIICMFSLIASGVILNKWSSIKKELKNRDLK